MGLDETSWFGDGRKFTDGPKNGNWGGKNWSGGQNPSAHGGQIGNAPPLDSADECYREHDLCYDKDPCDKKDCDKALVKCLKKLDDINPKNWPHPPRPGTEVDSSIFLRDAISYFD